MKTNKAQELIKTCFLIAAHVHGLQVDKAKKLYILHPLKVQSFIENPTFSVMKRSIMTLNDKERLLAQCVALLHDVIEDTPLTYDDLLINHKLPKDVCDAVLLLSKVKDEDDHVYYERLKHNKLARVVKLADLIHNIELSRLKRVTKKEMIRRTRYLNYMLYLWQD